MKKLLENKAYSIIPLISIISGVCVILGGLVAFLINKDIKNWYPTLNVPSWNPPAWLFGPVWTILYIMMGAALAIYIKHKETLKGKDVGIIFFIVQFALNLLWSIIFFNLHSLDLAFYEIILLLIFIILTTFTFIKTNKTTGFLMLPYILWVSFASILNYTIWQMNK